MIWHVIIDGEQRGPLSRDQVLEYLHDGRLVGTDLVWRPGFTDWKPISELAEFWQPPTRGPRPPPLPAEQLRSTDRSDAVATPRIRTGHEKKASLWKAANMGLILSWLTLVLQIANGRGFELANYAQTASVSTISELAGQVLGGPLLFVIVAVIVNIFKRRLPKSDASAGRQSAVFVTMLAGTGIALALYGQWFFSSDENISGATRDFMMATMQPACVKRQTSLKQDSKPSDEQISKYCQCSSSYMADNTTYKGVMRDLNTPDGLAHLKQQAEAAGQQCRTQMGL